jgi:DNA-directed RNA polymerase specialized sigma24 family protein
MMHTNTPRDFYTVTVTRDEETQSWLAQVDELPEAHTFARTLSALDGYVREVIVLVDDLPDEAEAEVAIRWAYATGDAELDALLNDAERVRRARAQLATLTSDTKNIGVRLLHHGLSQRDTGALLGIAHQAVSKYARTA